MMGTLSRGIDELLQMQKIWDTNKSTVWGISTGFPSLDELTGGFHKGEVFTLGARTSHGKTAFGTQALFKIAMDEAIAERNGERQGRLNLIFTPEMSLRETLLRQASVMSRVPSKRIKRGLADATEIRAWKEASEILRLLDPFLDIQAQKEPSIQDIIREIESLHAHNPQQREIGVVMIDYLQYLSSGIGGGEGYDHTSNIAREVKNLANRLDIPIVLLSQLNRKAADADEDNPPQLHELEGSGKIEARADTVGLLYRPIVATDDFSRPQRARMDIAKNRNGEVGVLFFWYYPSHTFFEDPLERSLVTWQQRVPEDESSEHASSTASSTSFENALEETLPPDTRIGMET